MIESFIFEHLGVTPRKIIATMFVSTASMIFLLFFYHVASAESHAITEAAREVNNRPIIGILSQEISYALNQQYPSQYDSYIAASYVKFVEGAGARVVPIWIGQDEGYYENILQKVNGVLWPGGATWFNQSDGYADAGDIIYRIAKRMNNAGDYFPIFGICLGFELMTYVAANRVEHRDDCSSYYPLPLEFKPDFQRSRLFANAPADVINILRTRNVTANYHRYCVTEEALARVHLDGDFKVLSVNRDRNDLQFVSAIEHRTYPFYGVQFHPEKNIYEWVRNKKIPHGANATRAAQYFADFFVEEARKSTHHFPSANEELCSLIYNYPAVYTGLKKSVYVQCYMFKKPY